LYDCPSKYPAPLRHIDLAQISDFEGQRARAKPFIRLSLIGSHSSKVQWSRTVTLVAAIALLWAISLLSLAATLPHEFWARADGHRDR
jgi:hypothetical protein